MEFDLTWVLWGLPLSFAAGWLASRFDLRQWRLESRSAPKAYYKGLNHLLNEQQDAAVDAFISAIQQDPDTTDLHFALGNLFRRRGDYDRAVRVHEHLLQRADLSPKEHTRARYSLAQDFIRAGLLDRAEDYLRSLRDTTYDTQALVLLLGLYERTREWSKASAVAAQLNGKGEAQFLNRITHHRCEQACEARNGQDVAEAERLLRQALLDDPQSVRVHLELADLLEHRQRLAEAWDQLQALCPPQAPLHLLALPMLVRLAPVLGHTEVVMAMLHAAQSQAPSIDCAYALAHLSTPSATQPEAAAACYLNHLKQEPASLLAAQAWLALQNDPLSRVPEPVLQAIDRASAVLRRYRCSACGFEAGRHFWQCPGCQSWDSYSPHRTEEL
jgi:lipopolysaccharide biosynthesis regulator YciM